MGKFYTIFLLAAGLLTGCCSRESEPEGDVIAQIGDSKLYREDVQRFIPATSTGEDSVNFTRRYINSWALNKLLVIEAQRRLSKEERDVAALVEEYKNQLLIYRLENRYIEQQLDTLVTRDEQESYYKSRQDEFKTKEGLVKGWTVTMHGGSPLLAKVRSLLLQNGNEGNENPEEFLYNAAYKYHNFTENWIDISTVARDMEIDTATLLHGIRNGNVFFENSDPPFCRFLYVTDFIGKGELSPFEYNAERIESQILSNRKLKLLSDFHHEILNKALDNRDLKIIEK